MTREPLALRLMLERPHQVDGCYSYAKNSPAQYYDPSGLAPTTLLERAIKKLPDIVLGPVCSLLDMSCPLITNWEDFVEYYLPDPFESTETYPNKFTPVDADNDGIRDEIDIDPSDPHEVRTIPGQCEAVHPQDPSSALELDCNKPLETRLLPIVRS